ncbi:MAG: GatB/YqeY domain-containing protein [Clostridia bacterium]|nr:GatB/YqeY domain-containing protein [Clostridia bacterium]
MSLKDQLVEDMKAAMKDKEAGKLRLSVIRMVRAAIKNAEIDKKKEFNDEEVIEVLVREAKQRRDAIEEYRKAGREDIVEQLQEEIKVLLHYLPEQMSAEEITALVHEIITRVGARDQKDMGKVMGALMPKVKGRADGKLVNQIVKEALGG